MPRLTVMMAAYRAEDTVANSMRAALRSMPRDSELVVAVDGPDQATLDAVAKVRDRRVMLINDADNVGTAVRHQQMLARTDSEYVANIDADDVCYPWRFALTLPVVHDKADMAFGSCIWFGQRTLRASTPLPLRPADVKASLPFVDPLLHSSMVARRHVLDRVGGYRKIGFAEDWELWMRAAARGARIWKIAAPVVGYRLSPKQMTQQRAKYLSELDQTAWMESQSELLATWGVPAGRWDGARLRLTQPELDRIVASADNPRYVAAKARTVTDVVDVP